MAEQDIPAMDYQEHDRTYHVFVESTKVTTILVFSVLVSILNITGAATGLGIAVASLLLIAALIAASAGVFARSGGWIAPAVIFALMFLQLIYVHA